MADKSAIVNVLLKSDNEIDLGEDSSDESNVERDWEYEEEDFQPQNPADSPPLACNSTESDVIMDNSQTYDVPSVSTPISSSNSTDNFVDTTDETNTGEGIDHESLEEASIELNANVDEDNQNNDSFEDVSLANLQQQYQQQNETVTRSVGTRGVTTRGGVRGTRGKAQATTGRGRGHGRGQNCTAQNSDETWKWVSNETVEEQNVPPVFLDHEQLNTQMQSTRPLDFF